MKRSRTRTMLAPGLAMALLLATLLGVSAPTIVSAASAIDCATVATPTAAP